MKVIVLQADGPHRSTRPVSFGSWIEEARKRVDAGRLIGITVSGE